MIYRCGIYASPAPPTSPFPGKRRIGTEIRRVASLCTFHSHHTPPVRDGECAAPAASHMEQPALRFFPLSWRPLFPSTSERAPQNRRSHRGTAARPFCHMRVHFDLESRSSACSSGPSPPRFFFSIRRILRKFFAAQRSMFAALTPGDEVTHNCQSHWDAKSAKPARH